MSDLPLVLPGHLVDGAWLERHLEHPDLRIVDATVVLDPASWQANSGRTTYDAAHVPGAVFVDLIEELSDPAGDEGLPPGLHAYRLPDAEAFAAAIGRHGIGPDTVVVAYDTSAGMWAARLWWMLRVFGHDRVAVLDGGWGRWVAEQRPVSDAVVAPAPATFTARLRRELLATKDDVARAVDDPGTVLVNALWPELFRGEAESPLPRKGRIPGSINVPFTTTIDEEGRLLPVDEVRRLFAEAGAGPDRRVITYCGGGIAASSDALALAVAGIDAAVYDGSLVEWVADPDAPLEVG
jgi:thiosulfate/3-mercaptopyruvate sulfurtransferase